MSDRDRHNAASAGAQNVAGISPLGAPLTDHERAVIAALREVAYGEVEIVVHNAKIVQITRSQKFRFNDRTGAHG